MSGQDQNLDIETKPRIAAGESTDPGLITRFQQPLNTEALHRVKTARLLAVFTFVAVCVVFLVHLGIVAAIVWNHADAVDQITRIFSIWVPIFAGYFGSAATFYFTQERR